MKIQTTKEQVEYLARQLDESTDLDDSQIEIARAAVADLRTLHAEAEREKATTGKKVKL